MRGKTQTIHCIKVILFLYLDSVSQTFENRPIGHDDLKKVQREQNHESTAGQSISNGQLKSGINQ